jgi:hypothetical protein
MINKLKNIFKPLSRESLLGSHLVFARVQNFEYVPKKRLVLLFLPFFIFFLFLVRVQNFEYIYVFTFKENQFRNARDKGKLYV